MGIPRAFFEDLVEPEVLLGFDQAIGVLRALGVVVQEIDLPAAPYGRSAGWVITYSEAFTAYRSLLVEHTDELTPDFVRKVGGGAFMTAEDYLTAQRIRRLITAQFMASLSEVDIVATPTVPDIAHPIGQQPRLGRDPGSFTRPVSLTGLPALALPCGFNSAGLPMSIQLIARPWEEQVLFRLGGAYEAATDWLQRVPPMTKIPDAYADKSGARRTLAVPDDVPSILDVARPTGLDFLDDRIAATIAAELDHVREQLRAGRELLDRDVEPPLWTSPWP